MKPDASDARTVHESASAAAQKSAALLKIFLAGQHDQRRDLAVANDILDVLRASSLTETEVIDVAKRIVNVIERHDRPEKR